MPKHLSLLAVALVALLPHAAFALDGGETDAMGTFDAGGSDDAHVSIASDAAIDGAQNCIAVNEPCTKTEQCCNPGAYCGAFGGAGGSLVCGLDNANSISTGNCNITHSAPGNGGESDFTGLMCVGALALGMTLARKRR